LLKHKDVNKAVIQALILEKKEVLLKQLKNFINVKLRNLNRKLHSEYDRLIIKTSESTSNIIPEPNSLLRLKNTEMIKSFDQIPGISTMTSAFINFKKNRDDIKIKVPAIGVVDFSSPHKKRRNSSGGYKLSDDTSINAKMDLTINQPTEKKPIQLSILNLKKLSPEISYPEFYIRPGSGVNSPTRFSRMEMTRDGETTPFSIKQFIKTPEKIFDSKDYRKSLECKNYKDLSHEIVKVTGKFLRKGNNRNVSSILFPVEFEKKLIEINSLSNIYKKKVDSDDEDRSEMFCSTFSTKMNKSAPKTIYKKVRQKKAPVNLKKDNIPIEIKMKYFKVLRTKKCEI
jgi:hypothetical protein